LNIKVEDLIQRGLETFSSKKNRDDEIISSGEVGADEVA
jgi:hypothetical protein